MIPLTERLLADAGGWQVMKQARSLHEMGRVRDAAYEPPLLQGQVREGETEYRAGLRIATKSNIENLCGCRASRQRGEICAHSLAVGLEVMRPRPAAPAPKPAPVVAAPAPPAASIFSATGDDALAELFIILAPNFASAWEKGAVTVGAEIALAGRRILLSAVDASRRYRCAEADLRAIEALRALNGGDLPGMAMLGREAFLQLLPALAGHPRVTFGKTTAAAVEGQGTRLPVKVAPTSSGGLSVRLALPAGAQPLVGNAGAWMLAASRFTPLAPGLPAAYRDLLLREVTIPAAGAAGFLAREVPALRAFFDIDAPEPADAPDAPDAPTPGALATTFRLALEGSLNFLTAEIEALRGDRRTSVGIAPGDPSQAAALGRLRASGFTGPDAAGKLTLRGEPAILTFFARALPALEREWKVTIGARFEHVTRDVERIQPRLEVRSSGESWFDLNVELATPGGERFSAAEIQRLIQSGRNSVRLRSGKLAVFNAELLDEFQQVLTDCEPQQRQPGLYRIDRRHAAYVEGLATEHHLAVEAPTEWTQWATAPRQLDRLRPIPLGPLEDILRPYQKDGVYWLHFLAQNGLCGVLADEMGLGKTLQTLAFLQHAGGRCLVVCPSSLVVNWQREAERFTPGLKCLAITGPDRAGLFAQIATADLVITSYALLRRDAEKYAGVPFNLMILDEAQHIKNPDSQNAQSAQAIRAKHRFVLTGTPIENSLRDIWSIMNFLMPGYLGRRQDFKERFEDPISRDPSGPEHRRLIHRLKPFILRRLKKTVAKELPDKIEQVAYCELTPKQRAIYDGLLQATKREISTLAGAKDAAKSRMVMLTALLRLRQTCCDLRLLKSPDLDEDEASAKLELLQELLQEAIDGGHRVIVFSQFVSMLHLIRDQLTEAGIAFNYLDGATRDRQGEVDAFQKGDAPVFLMSLKAGGVGLNITAADTVIHFDPWWNPAVEAQATDRVHRIGQKRVVTAYKLIARNTVEDKILTLQTKKRGLIDATIENEEPLMERLGMDDIAALLE